MSGELLKSLIVPAAGLVVAIGGSAMWLADRRRRKKEGGAKMGRLGRFGLVCSVIGIWVFVVRLLPLVFGQPQTEEFTVSLFPERSKLHIGNYYFSETAVTSWVVMAALVVLALMIRIFVIPRMKRNPKGVQNILELMVDSVKKYTNSRTEHLGEGLSAYIFSIAALMIACAVAELFGVRAPTADITMTLALALGTFVLINFYGIRRKGIGGRLKSLAEPTPAVFILRVISDLAIPVSLACRLFGNMLGGMIVMDLLYSALGSSAVGIPSVLGLYFNVFHPLIQAFIFVTLSLTFINEATE